MDHFHPDLKDSQTGSTPSSGSPLPPKSSNIVLIIIIILAILVASLGGTLFFRFKLVKEVKPNSSDVITNTSGAPVQISSGPLSDGHINITRNDGKFADYKEEVSSIKPSIPFSSVKLSELTNLPDITKATSVNFSHDNLGILGKNGFLVLARSPLKNNPDDIVDRHFNTSDEMANLYKSFQGDFAKELRKPENALFVSSDFLLHSYHVLIDRTWQEIEEKKFHSQLLSLTKSLYEDARERFDKEKDPALKASWGRVSAYYLLPRVILETAVSSETQYFGDPQKDLQSQKTDDSADSLENALNKLDLYKSQIPSDLYQKIKDELNLVMKAEGKGVSPLYGELKKNEEEDYSQYKPRSHYQKNSLLRTYFRAMMWFGRMGFPLKNSDLTRDAILITWQLQNLSFSGNKLISVWENIYLPTVFFVGKSDDLTVYDYGKIVKKIYPGNSPPDFSNKDNLQKFQDEAQKLSGPQIMSGIYLIDPKKPPSKEALLSDTKGFRFMGQRFIPDSYMLSQLTQGDEAADPETNQKLPSTPTGLLIMSILGSKTAEEYLQVWIKDQAPDSDKIIAKVKSELTKKVAGTPKETWTQNIYWAWIYNLLPLFDDFKDGYPFFMQNPLWKTKNLVTAFGSWTELRHDTLLYSKQSYAEMGGGRELPEKIPPVPKGYVEPNLTLINRLISLNNMTKDGLVSRELIDESGKEKFTKFGEALTFFQSIAQKELTDTLISDEDFETLRNYIGTNFSNILWPSVDLLYEKNTRTGLIADIHTDAKKNQILYEAVGTPYYIFVAVKDKNGARLTRGLVYSHYEFTAPLASRFTDDDWQGMIYDGKNTNQAPDLPFWSKDLVKK